MYLDIIIDLELNKEEILIEFCLHSKSWNLFANADLA
jgi:hypothetical protein